MTSDTRDGWIASGSRGSAGGHLLWLTGIGVVAFFVPFAAVSLAALPRPWFVLCHMAVSGSALLAYARWAGIGLAPRIVNLRWGLLAGGAAAAVSVAFVLAQLATPRPGGPEVAGQIVWLGLVYGSVDAILLTVFPVYAVFAAVRRLGRLQGIAAWTGAVALAMSASLAVTALYHLGFPEFRGAALAGPLIGNGIVTLAYLASGSPIAPVLAHVALHVAAVWHALDTAAPLPPHY